MNKFLPRIGSPGYYVLLAFIALFILGPLGGITAAYMNFALGTFVGGQVLAGILGSVVTIGYGAEGKHGANYMQTMAASVASMSAMGVLIQAMVWLGMPSPPAWLLVLYFLCIGMFGVGVGMLYTPILVDKLQLTYPSGLAVANILRALTDRRILKRSIGSLGTGLGSGLGISILVARLGEWVAAKKENASTALVWASSFSAVTFGGGMIVGARNTASVILVGGVGLAITPWLRDAGYIGPNDPFRKIGFIFALGTILGAAVIDMGLLARDAIRTIRAAKTVSTSEPKAKTGRLIAWVVFWALALMIVANQLLAVPLVWVAFAIVMAFLFQMINGISQGITDQNPISSAFVVTVLLMATFGLRDPLIGLFAGSILLVSCTVGVDMQQDRSTGWRLGSDRTIQFRFQVLGIVGGAILSVVMTRLFMEAYPVLKTNLFANPGAGGGWQSTMTYKFVGVLNTLAEDKSKTLSVMLLGGVVGLIIQTLRKVLLGSPRYKAWKERSAQHRAADFTLDALLLASPYAASLGGFVDFRTALWWGLGGIFASLWSAREKRQAKNAAGDEALPEDMSAVSLVGGGLIAGDSLFALYVGVADLIARGALGRIFGS